MSAFAKHGINHLSASSLNLWREHPGLWALRYLGQVRDEDSPAIWRGKAVEDGMTALLHGRDPLPVAMTTFEANAVGEASEDVEDERGRVAPMIEQIRIAMREPRELVAAQLRVDHWLDGVPVPFLGYIDYLFEDAILDLKTTKALPSSPKIGHVRQVALYSAAKGRPSELLYVTPKKFGLYRVSDADAERALNDLRSDALSLEAFLSRVDSATDALHCLPLNQDDFRVNQATIAAHAQMLGA